MPVSLFDKAAYLQLGTLLKKSLPATARDASTYL